MQLAYENMIRTISYNLYYLLLLFFMKSIMFSVESVYYFILRISYFIEWWCAPLNYGGQLDTSERQSTQRKQGRYCASGYLPSKRQCPLPVVVCSSGGWVFLQEGADGGGQRGGWGQGTTMKGHTGGDL